MKENPGCEAATVDGLDCDMGSETLQTWLSAPLTPVIVKAYVPAGVPEETLTVNWLGHAPERLFWLKPPVTPAGNPVALSETAPANPFNGVTVSAYTALDPGALPAVPTLTVKSGAGALTVTLGYRT